MVACRRQCRSKYVKPVPAATPLPRGDLPVLTTPWTDAELKQLKQLVNTYGRGDWQGKAKQLGTGRTSASTGAAWRRYEASLKEEGGEEVSPMMMPPMTAARDEGRGGG